MIKFDAEIVRLCRLALIGNMTEEERTRLEKWLAESDANRLFYENLVTSDLLGDDFDVYRKIDVDGKWKRFQNHTGCGAEIEKKNIFRGKTLARKALRYAAFGALFLSATLLLLRHENLRPEKETVETVEAGTPGSNKAVLFLSDGEKVELHALDSGEWAVKGESAAIQTSDGLKYAAGEDKEELRYNELKVPRGGEFKIKLSDGTLVHLNSDSRLKYPVSFAKNERKVSFAGEAYFEVAKDTARPFYVETDDLRVKVYGTSFNINTQNTQNVKTVLVEGHIGIQSKKEDKETEVFPGQLADFNRLTGIVEVSEVDTDIYTDWRNGLFRFEDETLENILHALSLWYDMEVSCENPEIRNQHFTGHLKRYGNVRIILETITETIGVHFKISNNTIIVY